MAWRTLALEIEGSRAEALAEALEARGAVSVATSDADAGTAEEQARFAEPGAEPGPWPRCRLDALFPDGTEVDAIAAEALAEAGAAAGAKVGAGRLEDTDWVAANRRQFEPIKVTSRLWIVPTWHTAPDPLAINIVLDPGAAFGTGSHPTTRLMLEWLEAEVAGGEQVLDYGCGSGILAIAAMRLGAAAATGVDIDPLAIEAARYNSRQNDVEVQLLDAGRPLAVAADLTVANILANPLRMLAPLLAAHTRGGGALALAGILAPQAGEVAESYAPWFDLRVTGCEGEWVRLSGRRH
jgi:ribosomal protein L11 methyltransferase